MFDIHGDFIKKIIELSNLLKKVPEYFTKDDINQWAKEARNFNECKGLMENYLKASRLIKKSDKQKIEEIFSEIGEIENPDERRFMKLKSKFYINESYIQHDKSNSFISRTFPILKFSRQQIKVQNKVAANLGFPLNGLADIKSDKLVSNAIYQ